jgi:AcrR family transcriptional regulator
MEEIRRGAGVSNGSLYHHFGSRAELAAQLLLLGMARSQKNVMESLSADAEAAVRGAVVAQLRWVQGNPQLGRLLYGDLADEVVLAAEPAFSERNRLYVEAVGAWLRDQAQRGTIVSQPFEIAHALWLGPTQEFARHWLRGRSKLPPKRASAALADGAWRSLTGG